MIRATRAVHCPERRRYVDTARATSVDGLIDNIAVERVLNGEPVDGLTEAEQRLAARLLHANHIAVAVIARRIGAGETRVKTWLGLRKPAGTQRASDRSRA
ncbi:hypothetical protein ACFV84_35165 [Kitasatospora sp. NPDC059811]|uniref:hypothetical protein n=1 Tax=Streptomycetaceae TaxID=2062 RepID=UPI0007AEFFD1|nr:hypothetical protein [Streptomyces sp. MJM8645]